MTFRRWLLIAGVAAGISLATLLLAYELAGMLGALGVVAYLGCILTPGLALYIVLAGRLRAQPSNLLEVVFFSNLLGFAMTEGGGWVLARSGWFSLPALLSLEGTVVVLATALFWRPLRQRFHQVGRPLLTIALEELAYLCIIIASACLLVMPLLQLFSNGFFVGTDTPAYTQVGWLVATTGHWPSLAPILWPSASPADVAPGVPMVYAVFSAVTGVFAPPMATVIALIPLGLTPIGLCLLVRRYSSHPLLTYGLPLVWVVGTTNYAGFLFNNTLPSIYVGSHPDVVLGLPFLVAVFLLLVDLGRERTSQWFETALLSSATLASILASQLEFVFVAAAFLFLGIGILRARGVRWSLVRLGVILAPAVVACPLYLIPGSVVGPSQGISSGSIWKLSEWQLNWSLLFSSAGVLSEICAVIVALAALAVVYERFRKHPIGSASSPSNGILAFTGVGLLALYFAYVRAFSDALGVIAMPRLLSLGSMTVVPVIAFGLDRFLHLRLPTNTTYRRVRARRVPVAPVLAAIGVAVLLVYAGVSSLETGAGTESKSADAANLVTPSIMAASEWLKEHAPATATIAIDANGGNNGAVTAIATYSDHVFVKRLRNLLYYSLQLPPPQNISFDYVNRVMTDPSEANAAAAASLGIEYYVFQTGFSSRQITAYSLLPYFSLVYSNSQIDVFEYLGGSGLGFIPAVAYCGASDTMVAAYSTQAYGYAFSNPALPSTPNWITGPSNHLNGWPYVNYCMNIPRPGNYTFYVHSDVYSTSQFLDVSIGGSPLGQVYFLSAGPTLGTPLNLTLPAGPIALNLSFQDGTGGTLNPIDYLVLVPDMAPDGFFSPPSEPSTPLVP